MEKGMEKGIESGENSAPTAGKVYARIGVCTGGNTIQVVNVSGELICCQVLCCIHDLTEEMPCFRQSGERPRGGQLRRIEIF